MSEGRNLSRDGAHQRLSTLHYFRDLWGWFWGGWDMQLSKKQVGSWHEREGNRHFTGEAGFWKGRGWLLRSWKETTKQLTSFYQNVDSFVKSLQWSHQDAIQIFSLYRGVECLGPTEAIGQGTAITSKWYLLFLKQKWEKIIKPRKKRLTLKQSFFFFCQVTLRFVL